MSTETLDARARLAQADAQHTARGLGNALIGATLALGVTVCWFAYGWAWVAAYIAVWVACGAIVRRVPGGAR